MYFHELLPVILVILIILSIIFPRWLLKNNIKPNLCILISTITLYFLLYINVYIAGPIGAVFLVIFPYMLYFFLPFLFGSVVSIYTDINWILAVFITLLFGFINNHLLNSVLPPFRI